MTELIYINDGLCPALYKYSLSRALVIATPSNGIFGSK
jgi:hypothetical protein